MFAVVIADCQCTLHTPDSHGEVTLQNCFISGREQTGRTRTNRKIRSRQPGSDRQTILKRFGPTVQIVFLNSTRNNPIQELRVNLCY